MEPTINSNRRRANVKLYHSFNAFCQAPSTRRAYPLVLEKCTLRVRGNPHVVPDFALPRYYFLLPSVFAVSIEVYYTLQYIKGRAMPSRRLSLTLYFVGVKMMLCRICVAQGQL